MIYRPSARVRLQIRLDEGAQEAAAANPALPTSEISQLGADILSGATSDTSAINKNRSQRRALSRARSLLSPSELSATLSALDRDLAKLQSAQSEQERPGAAESAEDTDLVVVAGILPAEARIQRHGLRDAGECEVTIDFRDAPIDPRVVRSAFLEAVIGSVSPDEFEEGVLFGTTRDDGTLLSVVGREGGQDVRFGSSTRFVGFVDEWALDIEEDGDTVKLIARDVSALLRDQELPTGLTIDLTLPIADGIQKLVDEFVSSRGMRVLYGLAEGVALDLLGGGDRGPVPAEYLGPAQKARRGKVARRARAGASKMSVWDHIVDTTVALGFVPIVRGYELRIIEPRTFFADESEALRLVYGRNLERLGFARKVGGVRVPTVEVRAADRTIGRTRWARAPVPKGGTASGIFGKTNPPKSSRASKLAPSGVVEDAIQVFNISGVYTNERLEQVARALFEQIGRQEIEGSFSTADITSLDGVEGDLLNLQPGDALEVLIAPLNDASSGDELNQSTGGAPSSLQELQSMSIARRAAYLESLGWRPAFAQRLAAAQEQSALVTTFRAQDVEITWSTMDGLTVAGDFINFLVVRETPDAAEPPAAQDIGAAARANQAARRKV